jgi:hypothetical protein
MTRGANLLDDMREELEDKKKDISQQNQGCKTILVKFSGTRTKL